MNDGRFTFDFPTNLYIIQHIKIMNFDIEKHDSVYSLNHMTSDGNQYEDFQTARVLDVANRYLMVVEVESHLHFVNSAAHNLHILKYFLLMKVTQNGIRCGTFRGGVVPTEIGA